MSSTTANHYSDPVLVKVEVEIQSEHTAAFLAALREFVTVVLATEPCDSFEVFRDVETGTYEAAANSNCTSATTKSP